MILYGQNHHFWLFTVGTLHTKGTFIFMLMSQSLLIVIRNLKMYKFAIASGMNEDFFSQFFLTVNLILAYGTQVGR